MLLELAKQHPAFLTPTSHAQITRVGDRVARFFVRKQRVDRLRMMQFLETLGDFAVSTDEPSAACVKFSPEFFE
jgi:hypothetical protein